MPRALPRRPAARFLAALRASPGAAILLAALAAPGTGIAQPETQPAAEPPIGPAAGEPAADPSPTREPGFAPSAADIDALLSRLPRAGAPPAEACAARAQTVADEMFILHTQLMVTSLACGEAYDDADLHRDYRLWATAQESVLGPARTELSARLGSGDALDAYRTSLANAESLLINENGIGRYCAMRQSRFRSLIDASPEAFSAYAEETLAWRQVGC